MEIFKAIKMRRSVRRYNKDRVHREKVERILEAAMGTLSKQRPALELYHPRRSRNQRRGS